MADKQITGNTLPGYHQIRRYVFSLIATAVPGEEVVPLTTERELCELFGMSRGTVRKALQLLTDEGLLVRRQHYGTFISPQVIRRSLHMPMIGIIIGDGNNSYHDNQAQALLSGLYQELSLHQYLLHQIQFFGNPQQTIEAELRGKIAGIIWIWLTDDRLDVVDTIEKNEIPLIHLIPKIKPGYGTNISLDLETYGYELACRLLKKGHSSDLLFVDTNDENISCSKRKGIERAFVESGIRWDRNNYINGRYELIFNEVEQRLNSGNYRVVNATGSFLPFKENYPDIKFVIPEVSLSLCSADDDYPCVAIPSHDIGILAAKIMHNHLTHPSGNHLCNHKIPLPFYNNQQ